MVETACILVIETLKDDFSFFEQNTEKSYSKTYTYILERHFKNFAFHPFVKAINIGLKIFYINVTLVI